MSSFSVSALASELCARPEDRIGGYPRKLGGCYRHARSQGTGQGWNIDPSLTALPESPLLPLANFAIEFLNFQNFPDPKIDDFKLLYIETKIIVTTINISRGIFKENQQLIPDSMT